ncbi:transcriptional regulator [Frankia sp. CcI156]|nr:MULTISPECIES: BTAD domain-containing putative transcriptional regulator [unclassified Frankia]OFB40200.1 transcriptional regulator [Frankia sp. CgIM4]OHV54379.1 transcriptional regulator [Frankia sp. CgIS1]ONH25572.1 transcriptional regulator [Frankia sp. CcI156]
MVVSLMLLDGVRWEGTPVMGDRPRALLAALASEPGRPVRAQRLAEMIWGEGSLANPAKGLQVVVSRTRAACGAGAVVRDGDGYRLGLLPTQVDSCLLGRLVAEAAELVAVDPRAAVERARAALDLGAALPPVPVNGSGPLAGVRRAAGRDLAAARLLLARATSRTGEHAKALGLLEAAHAQQPDDEDLLVDLLRSEAAVRGPAAALGRFERYRRDLRERLGTSPGETLTRVQRDLLALDRPVRGGIRYDATPLLGRQHDVERLRALLDRSRVVSIVGPGGLGKTRLAHLLARDSTLPVVHVVHLVGVAAPEDLIGEVGSALGVRDSIGDRRVLTPAQRADLRARIAARLARGPGLLLLDNCEHLVAEVAELVAFLVTATADLRVLTTSRAPLAIGAERVYLLGELVRADAVELFSQRATAARPTVRLDREVVGRIVDRLDGLPLAIELAAARVRAMSVEDVDRRLADRFALLRGGDRAAPDRHRTLLAVIDWSWNLLAEPERRSLRRLALFPDGFTLEAAEEILAAPGPADEAAGSDPVNAVDAVQNLVEQSLLSVREPAGGVRYRMLETVREFGRLRLAESGEQVAARRAQRDWAVGYATRHGVGLVTERQFAAIDAIAAEETNLADELRDAVADGDTETVVRLLAVLGMFWAIRGEHLRMSVLIDAVTAMLSGWTPQPAAAQAAVAAGTAMATVAIFVGDGLLPAPIRELLERLGPEAAGDPWLANTARVLLALDPAQPTDTETQLVRLADGADRHLRLVCLVWLAHLHENAGEALASAAAAEQTLALATPREGPWLTAMVHTRLAELTMRRGDFAVARSHAQAALPVLERLGARDDVAQLRVLLAFDAVNGGRLDAAEEYLAQIDPSDGAVYGGPMMAAIGRAELAIVRGDTAVGLRQHLDAAAGMRALRWPGVATTGVEPWVLAGDAVALAAFAWHAASADDLATGHDLFRASLVRYADALRRSRATIDYPACGTLLFAFGVWGLRDGRPAGMPAGMTVREAVQLLALAKRFSYIATIPSLGWARVEALAERRAPGALPAARSDAEARRPAQLFDEACILVERLAERLADLPPGRDGASPGHGLQVPLVADDRHRQEDHDHGETGEQRPADLPGEHAVVGQVPRGGDQV